MSILAESKMDDKEVLKAAKSLAKNGKDEKTKSFGQGLVDYYKENDSFTPNQVSGLQNIMKNASFQMAKEDTDVSAEDFINHVEREDFVEAKEIFNTLIHQKAYEHIKSSEAEIAAKMFESVSRQSDLDSDKPVIVKGVKGMKSKPFTKKFKNQQAADKWIDDNEDDIGVTQIVNEDFGKDRMPMNEVKEEGTINEAKITDDHWAIVKRNGSFYSGKSEIKKIVNPTPRGNPPSMKMINTYGGDAAVKVNELKKMLKGMRNTDDLMKQLGESFNDRLPMNEVKEEGTITVKELEPGKSYTFYDEMGTSFKATVKSIRRSGANKVVKYTYDDNSYGNRGQTDEFEVSDDEKVFMEDIGSKEKRDFKRREMETELGSESVNNVSISINGKIWKVIPGESENPTRALAKGKRMADTIKRNAAAKGKKSPKVDVRVTSLKPTETSGRSKSARLWR